MAFQNILCATDLSEGSAIAVREADTLARHYGARFEVLLVEPAAAVAPVLDPLRSPPPYSEAIRAEAGALEALRASVFGLIDATGPAPDLWVEHGSPADVIVERARALGADLIVVGASGGSGGRTEPLGAVADHVLRHAPTSVLVARESRLRGAVLSATDFSDAAQRAVRVAGEEARRRGVWLTVLHSVAVLEEAMVAAGVPVPSVPPPPSAPRPAERAELRRRAEDRLQKIRADAAVECDVVATDWDPVLDILQAADRKEAQLIAVGRVGRTGLERLLLGSVTEEVARSARCSVLAVA
jgi:nucleotide-binding universal stress UspA family protein